jgi:hypothetical protein
MRDDRRVDLNVWCIFVPTVKPKATKKRFFRTKHHKAWDKYVRNISGGLTILAPSKGQWIDTEDNLVEERVLPVQIACNDEQFEKIIKFTLKHYDQDALMYYKMSNEVFITNRPRESNDE